MVRVVMGIIVWLYVSNSLLAVDALPANVIEALNANITELNGLQISGSMQRHLLMPATKGLKLLKTKESEDEFTQQIQFDIKINGNRFYESIIYPPSKYHSEGERNEISFDGEKHYAGAFRPNIAGMPGILQIQSSEKVAKLNPDVANLWFLWEAGFAIPKKSNELEMGIRPIVSVGVESGTLVGWKPISHQNRELLEVEVDFPEPWSSDKTGLVKKDPNITSLPRETAKIQASIEEQRRSLAGELRRCRLWLDPKLNYAVRQKWESRTTGEILFHTVCSDFTQVDDTSLWLPKHCKITSHAYFTHPSFVSSEPVFTTDIKITEIIRKQFKPDDFRIWYDAPGSMVADYTHPDAATGEAVGFFVPGEVANLENSDGVFSSQLMIIAANLAAVMLFLFWLVWRRRNQNSV